MARVLLIEDDAELSEVLAFEDAGHVVTAFHDGLAALRALELVETELLDLARVESGLDDPREPIDLRVLVERAIESVERAGIEIAIDGSASVRGVPARLELAIRNLIENAEREGIPPAVDKLGIEEAS